MPQLLLELFSEEIPARMQQGAARDLERMAAERLKAAGLTYDALATFAGPRRLTLVVDGLPAATPDREEELKGPKASAPEQALEGFLRKTGLTREQLVERDGVLFAVISQKGQSTAALIPGMVDQIVRTFPWPKSMRWGSGTLRWVRPLKRIVALFDGAVVPFEIDGIQSGDTTEGHRFLGLGKPFAVSNASDYFRKLEENYVVVGFTERRTRILRDARAACEARGLAFIEDEGLLDEVAGLAEWPVPIVGDMDPSFLDLPPEVVRLSMKVHQKYFVVGERKDIFGGPNLDRPGRVLVLSPHFVVVANVEASDGGKALAAGNSRVLSARLNDARFFWDEDRKVGFGPWLEKLSGVTFHAKLGTLAERVERIAALAREIAPLVGADPDQAEKAARLAKADLASGTVGEFPELQGVMGGYYARAFGEEDAIADAIRDHYKPQGPSDTVPTAPLTVAVSLADKLDTLVGFFAIDEKPTGSKDPFALRRAALGVIRLVLENGVRFALSAAIDRQQVRASSDAVEVMLRARVSDTFDELAELGSATLHRLKTVKDERERLRADFKKSVADLREPAIDFDDEFSILPFFADRLTVLLRDQGQRHDLVAAVFALGDDDLVRIVRRVEALAAFLATDDGANLLAGYRRASNILKAEEKKGPLPTGMVKTGLPNQPAEETTLAFAAAAAATAVDAALETENFAAAMTALAALRAPVDAFFDKVMVNSEVASERENRLKLLGQVRAVMGRVADFGQIAG